MPRSFRLPLALRAALLAGLLAILLTGLPQGEDAPPMTRLSGDGAEDDDRLAALLLDPIAPAAVLRAAGDDPTELELQTLAAAAERAPLTVELHRERTELRVAPPESPLTDRYAAVRFNATATPGGTVSARLLGPDGAVLDSVRVAADSAGSAAGAFQVRPGRAGWTDWRVAVGDAGAGAGVAGAWAGAWVAEADPPRVLVVAGPPSWESRYALRALERSGVEVSLVQEVGRGNVITAGGANAEWATSGALAAYDVVILLPGAESGPEAIAAVEEWAAAGKGVLAASGAVRGLGLASFSPRDRGGASDRGGGSDAGDPVERVVRGDALVWTAPAEIAPLPAADLDARATPASGVPPGATVAARSAAGDPLLVLAPFGRGRMAWSGLRESWRWAMDAGLEEEHRAFWRSLVDWLATPSADSLGLRVDPVEAGVGSTVDIGLRDGALELRRPSGEIEAIAAARVDEGRHGADEHGGGRASGMGGRGRFVAVEAGVHELMVGGRTVAAFRSEPGDAAGAAQLARARLALIAAASGGAALEPGAFEAHAGAVGTGDRRGGWWLPWVFAALAFIAVAEWAVRRRRGLA